MDDMHDQHETPTSDAARGVGHYLTGALATADLSVRLLTWLRQRTIANEQEQPEHGLQPGDLEQAGQVLDPQRAAYTAMLGRDHSRAGSRTALLAWVSAQPHRENGPEAELVAGRAEARLRHLHPDALSRYDTLRAGLSPVQSMREVVPLIAREQQHTAARERFAPMLDPAVAASADSSQALTAWTAALPLADTLPDAAVAAAAAESRLRELHPDAMDRYDALRLALTPAAALDEVGPLIDPALQARSTGGVDDVTTASSAAPKSVQPSEERYAPVVREVLPAELAGQVLRDDAWPTLAEALAKAEQAGAQPTDMLRGAAAERELASAKSIADVLAFRIEEHQVPAQAQAQPQPPRTPTTADLVASSYPTPLAAARPESSGHPQDLAVLGAALELGREADTERQTARAAAHTADDVSTPRIDEHREGLNDARAHLGHAGADHASATALLGQVDPTQPTAAGGAPVTATAALSYPTPIKQVTAAQAAPKTTPATPAARPATRKAPTAGRRR